MKRKIFVLFLVLLFISPVLAEKTINNKETVYEISFDNAIHHEAEIKTTFSGLSDKPLEVIMSRSSPGYYIPLPFAKNVYNVKAFNSKGELLEILQPNEHQWNVSGHDGTIVFSYTLFADLMDGTYSSITKNHLYINIPSAFVWAKGLESSPIPDSGFQFKTYPLQTDLNSDV